MKEDEEEEDVEKYVEYFIVDYDDEPWIHVTMDMISIRREFNCSIEIYPTESERSHHLIVRLYERELFDDVIKFLKGTYIDDMYLELVIDLGMFPEEEERLKEADIL